MPRSIFSKIDIACWHVSVGSLCHYVAKLESPLFPHGQKLTCTLNLSLPQQTNRFCNNQLPTPHAEEQGEQRMPILLLRPPYMPSTSNHVGGGGRSLTCMEASALPPENLTIISNCHRLATVAAPSHQREQPGRTARFQNVIMDAPNIPAL